MLKKLKEGAKDPREVKQGDQFEAEIQECKQINAKQGVDTIFAEVCLHIDGFMKDGGGGLAFARPPTCPVSAAHVVSSDNS
ncbi:unnamed protein product, partial [Mesorhabditis belari]|uniref:Uncharacterized protein n=1 Tax=Mesorhabditis belari TaxID=2138241 RepID=A0AAF3ENE6_9BILA